MGKLFLGFACVTFLSVQLFAGSTDSRISPARKLAQNTEVFDVTVSCTVKPIEGTILLHGCPMETEVTDSAGVTKVYRLGEVKKSTTPPEGKMRCSYSGGDSSRPLTASCTLK